MQTKRLYETDFNLWVESQIASLQEHRWDQRNFIPEAIAKAYPLARRETVRQTRLPISTFPEQLPYTFETVMEWDFEAPGE